MNPITLELLSPAKNLEQGIAAIGYGADAVYVGAPRFGAREAASNSFEDVEQLIRYAHRYRAKVFVVVNTIVYEHELEEAERVARWAYNAGADALIVQDMAFLEMDLPPIALHASTQTHNIYPEKVKFLQDVGFERVILARELSLQQIADIRKQTNVELEAFVHGALCVSYSGQCYMSEAITGRSANRGACAQPCRSAYDLVDGTGNIILKNKHLLSLKDFNLSRSIRQLADAGICSFKIEGRLKNVDYVKNITGLYRKELDAILEERSEYRKASSGKVFLGFTPDAQKSFNRGFTAYFTQKREDSLTGFNTAKATGALVGTVTNVRKLCFEIDAKMPLSNGDGICFISKGGGLVGTNINKVDGRNVFPNRMDGITKGVQIFRNYDHRFAKMLEGCSTERLVDISINFTYTAGRLTMMALDADGFTSKLVVDELFEIAQKPERALQNIDQQLRKSGGGMFEVVRVGVDCQEVPFIPISTLNGYRRTLLESLEAKREASLPEAASSIIPNSIPYPEQTLDYSGNVVNSLSRKFYERHGVLQIDEGFELSHVAGAHLMTTKYCLRYELGACLKTAGAAKLKEPLFLENNGQRFRLQFDCARCQMVVIRD